MGSMIFAVDMMSDDTERMSTATATEAEEEGSGALGADAPIDCTELIAAAANSSANRTSSYTYDYTYDDGTADADADAAAAAAANCTAARAIMCSFPASTIRTRESISGSTLIDSHASSEFSTSSRTVVYSDLPGLSKPAMFLFSEKNSAGDLKRRTSPREVEMTGPSLDLGGMVASASVVCGSAGGAWRAWRAGAG